MIEFIRVYQRCSRCGDIEPYVEGNKVDEKKIRDCSFFGHEQAPIVLVEDLVAVMLGKLTIEQNHSDSDIGGSPYPELTRARRR